jgi:hypothetical protein
MSALLSAAEVNQHRVSLEQTYATEGVKFAYDFGILPPDGHQLAETVANNLPDQVYAKDDYLIQNS